MRRSDVLAVALVGACAVGAVTVGAPVTARAQSATAAPDAKQTKALFDAAKKLYDAGDHAGALAKFREGAALEPTLGRWPYNQALALRKLGRKAEAKEAFLKARAVQPDYRSAEVDAKLAELGYRPGQEVASKAEAPPAPPPTAPPPAEAAPSKAQSAQAKALFEQGKALYKIGDFGGALEKFREGGRLEPAKGRWPYNEALALRKLERKAEAREALLRAQAVEPDYQAAEVKKKLAELGGARPSTSAEANDPEAAARPAASDVLPTPPTDAPVDLGSTATGTSAAPVATPTMPARATAPVDPAVETFATIFAWVICLGGPLLLLGGLIWLIRWLLRDKAPRGGGGGAVQQPPYISPVLGLEELGVRLQHVSQRLVRVEHGMRLGEDEDARALLNQATQAEQRAYEAFERAREAKGPISAVGPALQEAEQAVEAAEQRLTAAFGAVAFSGEGEKVGCYFCARPLANSDFRVQVPVKAGETVNTVLACRPCGNIAGSGQAPPTKVLNEGGAVRHWSEVPGFDPYLHRHEPYHGSAMLPGEEFTSQRSYGELAAMAAGGAVLGGVATYAVSKLLDMDSARESSVARRAAQAAVRETRRSRDRDHHHSSSTSSSSWRDHS
ncbi:hypothetical protein P2318_03640 [Myxococcaceae bacterium GXIMD 01537]